MKSKRDTKKIYKRARDAYEWSADVRPSKKQRKQKRKERQDGKKEIRRETMNAVIRNLRLKRMLDA